VSGQSFARMLGDQVIHDLARLPATLRKRASEAGRAQDAVNVEDLRSLARRRIPPPVFDYVDGAASDELTANRNQADLRQIALRPHALAGVASPDLSTEVLGHHLSVPLLGAPTGLTGLVHHAGEGAIARAVHAAGGLYVLSSAASRTLEEVAQTSPGPRWFQLYVGSDRGVVAELLERARAAGYTALVVTVDVAQTGPRERDRRNGFTVPPRVSMRTLAGGLRRPRWTVDFLRRPRMLSEGLMSSVAAEGEAASLAELIGRQFDPRLCWDDIAWLRERWSGPLLLKGILRGEDARRAADLGATGVIVSNHGGRQLDRVPSSIRALPEVVDAVGAEIEVLMDGGIRRGADIIAALALGARACLVGRALVYGLAAGGEAGAHRAMTMLVDELRVAMTLLGCESIRALDGAWVMHDDRSPSWSM
jgi:isopentenyl diphosphate isomerase/L-lactate dehydrogenase-like FMN-dependent dehydrogenase